eukprot:gene7108-8479_t
MGSEGRVQNQDGNGGAFAVNVSSHPRAADANSEDFSASVDITGSVFVSNSASTTSGTGLGGAFMVNVEQHPYDNCDVEEICFLPERERFWVNIGSSIFSENLADAIRGTGDPVDTQSGGQAIRWTGNPDQGQAFSVNGSDSVTVDSTAISRTDNAATSQAAVQVTAQSLIVTYSLFSAPARSGSSSYSAPSPPEYDDVSADASSTDLADSSSESYGYGGDNDYANVWGVESYGYGADYPVESDYSLERSHFGGDNDDDVAFLWMTSVRESNSTVVINGSSFAGYTRGGAIELSNVTSMEIDTSLFSSDANQQDYTSMITATDDGVSITITQSTIIGHGDGGVISCGDFCTIDIHDSTMTNSEAS